MTQPNSGTLYEPLKRRPQATTVSVKQLIQKIQLGEIRVPDFQRPLRWKAPDVKRLLDSVWRGYPIGSLLFWKRAAPGGTVKIGGTSLTVDVQTDAWWVVDGQQRTTALAASLLELDHGADLRWSLYFDPLTATFEVGEPKDETRQVPVSVLGDLRRLGRWLREHSLTQEEGDVLEDAQQRLLDYSIPAYIVETDDDKALRAVFARLNSTGVRMRADEVFQALLGTNAAKDALDLNVLQGSCDVDGFGVPPRSEVMKAVLAMSGIDPTKRLEDFGAAELGNLVDAQAAEAALIQTAQFLIECGLPHVSLIPYPVAFIVLSRWFYLYPRTDAASRRLLGRWLWRGAVTGTHQRAEVSAMRLQVRHIRPEDQRGSLNRLLEQVNNPTKEPWKLSKFNSKNAQSRIEVLALLSLNPSDLTGRICLQALTSGGRIAREVFASKTLGDLDGADRALARTVANRVLLDSVHTGLVGELRRWGLTEKTRPILSSHRIDEDTYGELTRGNISAFLQRRAPQVASLVQTFLDQKTAWDEPNLHPQESYFEED